MSLRSTTGSTTGTEGLVESDYRRRRRRLQEQEEQDAAEQLSRRLLAIPDGDDDETEEEHDRVLRTSLRLTVEDTKASARETALLRRSSRASLASLGLVEDDMVLLESPRRRTRVWGILTTTLAWIVGVVCLACIAAYYYRDRIIGPPTQPTGPYALLERQEGDDFFQYYTFYEGRDSAGSNGYNMYVSHERAAELDIVQVRHEVDNALDNATAAGASLAEPNATNTTTNASTTPATTSPDDLTEPFVYLGSAPTADGPRDSIRLEGIRRFNRGLFIIDVRHVPVGCGVWPAFWLTDEVNWPVNGEIDIIEGVNYQSRAKTALHSTKSCVMDDVPLGTMTGTWDTAQGIPDRKTGKPDMTLREARNCFVYDPHQWLNQGCVAMDGAKQGSLGIPLNQEGGGVFVLEWDPVNRHIRTWAFTPHTSVPENLAGAIRTAHDEVRIAPDPESWPLPYGYFPIGSATNCPSSHFKHMRLVLNTAFCGSVAGNRFHLDCKLQVAANVSSCNEWIKSQPEELDDAYWKIRGVYVYQREWESSWSV